MIKMLKNSAKACLLVLVFLHAVSGATAGDPTGVETLSGNPEAPVDYV
ncbi:MAG: hypothetical protein ACXQT5_07030 [Candidatus Syntropharchaeia archaeon]